MLMLLGILKWGTLFRSIFYSRVRFRIRLVYVFKIAEKVCYERANNAKSASEIGRVNEALLANGRQS
jgi:hypothetical protein